MDNDDRDASKLWKIDRTLHEMARDRGYNVGDDELNLPLATFIARGASRSNLGFECNHTKDPKNKLLVHFVDVENVAKKDMKAFLNAMDDRGAQHGIMVYRKKMTPAAKKVIQEIEGNWHLEEYPENDLIVNITKHELVPKHQVMSPEEKKHLLERYRLKDTQLPRIRLDDPVAKYFGVKRGQVMKIERTSETAGRYVTYRIVM